MTKRTNLLRMAVVPAAVLTTTMVVAACASNATGSSGSAATTGAGSPSTSDGTSSAPLLPLRAGERFVNLAMSKPYTPSAPNGGTDEYRCLVVDPHLTKPAFLTGTQFQPGNVPIVHHAIVFAISPESVAAARAKDAAAGGQGWTCFGNDAVGNGKDQAWVDTWTPGASE